MADKLKPYEPLSVDDFTPATADDLYHYISDNNRRYEEY